MLRALFKAYAVVAATFFASQFIYEFVARTLIRPIVFDNFFPSRVLTLQHDTVIDNTFWAVSTFLEYGATWLAFHFARFAITLVHVIKVGGSAFINTLKKLASSELIRVEMGGWFSRNEVINNGTSSVVFHVETLKTTLLLVSGGILIITLGCVTARWCWMSRKQSARRSADAERGIAMRELEKRDTEHQKELANIRNSINLQNAQMGSAAGALASARALQQLPNAEAKHIIFPQF